MKISLILFFSSVVISQGAIQSEPIVPQNVTEISPVFSLDNSWPIPEPSTVLMTIMVGAFGVLRRKRS